MSEFEGGEAKCSERKTSHRNILFRPVAETGFTAILNGEVSSIKWVKNTNLKIANHNRVILINILR